MFEVYRVEDRSNPDGVDFWDSLTKEEADQWVADRPNWPNLVVRKLSDQEVIDAALACYKDVLSGDFNK